jgi:hypothetical protein
VDTEHEIRYSTHKKLPTKDKDMLSERLQRAIQRAEKLPEILQQDLAEQIEELLTYPALPPESISIRELIGDDGSDAFFDKMMDTLDLLGHSVPPTPLLEDF